MHLEFISSPKPTIGVEIELQILDAETLDLSPKANLFLERCLQKGFKGIKAEIHQSMLEIESEISNDVKESRGYLKSRIQQLNLMAKEFGLKLAITGTHPFQRWSDRLISHQDRYQKLHEKFQWLARRMNIYGLHVHVGVESGNQALAVSNALVPYLPHLLALSGNSPFWQGLDTGMQSSRISIMESFPFSGIPSYFNHWSEFEDYCSTLMKAEAIYSLKDLYWHIRPNLQFGTIEIRVCDAMATLDETMAVVAFIQCLVVFHDNQIKSNSSLAPNKKQHWIVPGNLWIAARDGLDGIISTGFSKQKISESIGQLIEQLTPTAKTLNCLEELQHLNCIINQGNGALRQRHVFEQTQSLKEVVNAASKEFQSNVEDGSFAVCAC